MEKNPEFEVFAGGFAPQKHPKLNLLVGGNRLYAIALPTLAIRLHTLPARVRINRVLLDMYMQIERQVI